jgi:hypothetical protein
MASTVSLLFSDIHKPEPHAVPLAKTGIEPELDDPALHIVHVAP